MSSETPPPFTQRMLGLLEPAQLMAWAMSRKYKSRTDAERYECCNCMHFFDLEAFLAHFYFEHALIVKLQTTSESVPKPSSRTARSSHRLPKLADYAMKRSVNSGLNSAVSPQGNKHFAYPKRCQERERETNIQTLPYLNIQIKASET
jgi:hypothetical protein